MSADERWKRERDVIADMARTQDVPVAEFPGHKGIYLANLEGVLGGRFPALLAERDSLEVVRSAAVRLADAGDGLSVALQEVDIEGEAGRVTELEEMWADLNDRLAEFRRVSEGTE